MRSHTVSISTSACFWATATARYNLAVVNVNTAKVSIFLGNGDKTFQSDETFAITGKLLSVAVEDFNGDGNADH
jgi:hypothetical protein